MISKEQFLAMHELRRQGVQIGRIAEQYMLDRSTVSRWLNMTEEEFDMHRQGKHNELEQYRGFILDLLRTCPQIRETNILFRLQEAFPEFSCKRTMFYTYMRKLREQAGLAQFPRRQISSRGEQPPGYEAQVDFGQFKMKDMYGMNVRVYFFCMVLSYSRMHFVYFSREPFNTTTAIEAHEYAFRFFGGRTQTIMYDQDKVFVVSENLGNIIFVPEFEEYVKRIGYSVVLCRPRDPQTKGRVEAFVKHVKVQFLEGRTYTGIDSLNSAALEWLDTSANAKTNSTRMREPRELFREESKHLIPVAFSVQKDVVNAVSFDNMIKYQKTHYEMPHALVKKGELLRVVENDGLLMFYRVYDGSLIYKCNKSIEEGDVVTCTAERIDMESVGMTQLRKTFEHYDCYEAFMKGFQKSVAQRYKNTQSTYICSLAKVYSVEKTVEAMEYCIKVNLCTAIELSAYLMARYGMDKAKKTLPMSTFAYCKKRTLEIVREQGWQT